MAELNWNMLQMPDIAGNALAAFDKGRQQKQKEQAQIAFQSYAANPNQNSLNALAQYDPKFVIDQRQTMQKQQATAQKNHQEQIGLVGRLLSNVRDEGSYQQALAAARQGGIDLTDVPPSYDPTWVDHTKMLVSAFEKDGGQQISGLARELQDAGYQPGTPGFAQAMKVALEGKYAPQYTDQQGNLRQGSLPQLPPIGSPAPQTAFTSDGQPMPPRLTNEPFTMEAYQGAVSTFGPQGAAEFLARNGGVVKVNTPEEAAQLPKGTRLILPDGSEGVVR